MTEETSQTTAAAAVSDTTPAAAAASEMAVDEETASATRDNGFGPNPFGRIRDPVSSSMRDMNKKMTEMGMSVSTYVQTSIETFKHHEGNTTPTDTFCATIEEGLPLLKEMVQASKEKPKQRRPQKWNFATAPYKQFGKTLDDVLIAFLKWSVVEIEDEMTEIAETKYNLSKAFRRLESYATWMDNTGRDLVDPPLETTEIEQVWKAWNMKLSHDEEGKLVWWMDLDQADMGKIKEMRPVETLRLFVWLAHCVMLDEKAQANGVVYCQNMAKVKFWTSMTLLPPRLSVKLDRLTIGVLPIKMKALYVVESPRWMNAILKMIKPFLSKKMRSRIEILAQNSENTPQAVLESKLGEDCIPQGFGGFENSGLTVDIVAEKYFTAL